LSDEETAWKAQVAIPVEVTAACEQNIIWNSGVMAIFSLDLDKEWLFAGFAK
jgi:hypothetical protein